MSSIEPVPPPRAATSVPPRREDDFRPGRYRFRPVIEELTGEAGGIEGAEALSRLRDRRRPVLLDSAGGAPRRFSLLAWDPLPPAAPASIVEVRAWLRQLEDRSAGGFPDRYPDLFRGGFLGAFAYDLGVEGEELSLPSEPWAQPLVVGGLYTDFLVRDEERGSNWLVLGEDPGDGRRSVAHRRREILDALAAPHGAARPPRAAGRLHRLVSSTVHQARIERARRFIAAGEIYQANLAYPMRRAMRGDPIDLYLRLRRCNPGPYAGYLDFGGGDVDDGNSGEGAILAASPELLLEFDFDERGAIARTRPIKGTIERGATPEEDRAKIARLRASEKDLAELAMIVDLERNDLGRAAIAGGVEVENLARVESYASVHHLVADVVSRPGGSRDAIDVLASLFPGGSITGVPKLRSMEVIAELEGQGRGFSYGSLGMIDLAGRARLNILIRTLLWRGDREKGGGAGEVLFRVGGGITWGSRAVEEEAETRAKAAALEWALEGEGEGVSSPRREGRETVIEAGSGGLESLA